MPFTFTFSEQIAAGTFTASDIANTGTSTGSFSAPSTSDNIIFTSNFTPTGVGTIITGVNASVCTDLAGNNNTAGSAITRTYYNSVAINTSAVSSRFTTTPATLNLTIANNYNRALLIYVTYYRNVSGGTTISGATWNSGTSQALTYITNSRATGNGGRYKGEFWYLNNPNTGAGTITVTFAGNPNGGAKIDAISLYNTDVSSMPVGANSAGNSANISTSITTTDNDSWTIQGISGQTANPTISGWGTDQTELTNWRSLTNLPWSDGSWKQQDPAGATTMTATLSTAQRWHASCAEIKLY